MAEVKDSEQKTSTKKKIKKGGAMSLYKIGRGRRGKKKEEEKESKKKKAPGTIRVQSDLADLELPYNVTMNIPNKANIMTFNVTVTPDQGMWCGATYKFTFEMPKDYPYKPPKVHCDTLIYHPNIDLKGNVCLNLLKADWKPILTIQQVIHGLIFLFLEPNPADPLNIEGILYAIYIVFFIV